MIKKKKSLIENWKYSWIINRLQKLRSNFNKYNTKSYLYHECTISNWWLMTFKFGMEDVFCIQNKVIHDSMSVIYSSLREDEFELNTYHSIICNISDPGWFSKNRSEIIKENFLNDQYSLIIFRITLAEQFCRELRLSRGKQSNIRFSLYCSK